MQDLLEIIDKKKLKLDELRPLSPGILKNIQDWFRIELTYNSNVLEGNTLTKRETALVVEQGLTIGGKTVREHLEVINYAIALDYIKELAQKRRDEITLQDILSIHRMVLKGIDEEHAGCLRTVQVYISGSDVKLPHPVKAPEMMDNFIVWLQEINEHPVTLAADAHFKLVEIHPFIAGNGRTARLLMNLLLMQSGYPPAIIEFAQRERYIDAIEQGEIAHDLDPFYTFIYQAVDQSLDKYLEVIQ